MRSLHLLRHAKSSWDDPRLDDHDRPLNQRGVEAGRLLRRHLTDAGVAVDLVLCSTARRTVMTLEAIRPALPETTEVRVEEDLYGASDQALLTRLRQVDDSIAAVMVIAHNPGLEDLAELLVGAGDDALRDRLTTKFPTGALAGLSFTGRWADLAAGDVTLDFYVVPRDLS